jgi:hypothetical protein
VRAFGRALLTGATLAALCLLVAEAHASIGATVTSTPGTFLATRAAGAVDTLAGKAVPAVCSQRPDSRCFEDDHDDA